MKKYGKFVAAIICFVLLAIFSGIGLYQTIGRNVQIGEKARVNFVDYSKENTIIRLDIDEEVMADTVSLREEEYIKEAEYIVKGKIKGIQYCEYQGTPWRRLRVQVLDTIAGKVKEGEEIVVYLIGGYLSSKEYYSYFFDKEVPKGKEYTLYEIEMRPEESITEEEDTVIFLLEQASKKSPFESTAYESVGGYDVEYIYDKHRKQYKQYKTDGAEKYWRENILYKKFEK